MSDFTVEFDGQTIGGAFTYDDADFSKPIMALKTKLSQRALANLYMPWTVCQRKEEEENWEPLMASWALDEPATDLAAAEPAKAALPLNALKHGWAR